MPTSNEAEKIIFNLNRLPFHDFDAAAQMRDLLHKESGNHYRIEQYQDGVDEGDNSGFVVIRSRQDFEKLRNDETRRQSHDVNSQSGEHDDMTPKSCKQHPQ